ncbi:caspase family protein [Nostoc sp. NMS9]|uniref:caspase family protein n=1 Tax=Nostoc sp. NMS9 TaxID=2815393 RepID=UPI002601557F|nr:caspase family protein [Nostoc sp. NMS9]MBN3943776.1 caspase family protein [Nostoc sp. NMS9]
MTNQTFTNGYALLIGVGADLPVTVKDATAIRDILIDGDHAAYPSEQVTLLTETSATRQKILAAFDQIIAQVNQNPDATVIIYYSGHGGRIQRTNEYFLVPATSLTAGGRRRSQQKLDAFQAEFDIRSEKLKQIKKAVAIEAGKVVNLSSG